MLLPNHFTKSSPVQETAELAEPVQARMVGPWDRSRSFRECGLDVAVLLRPPAPAAVTLK
jgi:hypothetical protein